MLKLFHTTHAIIIGEYQGKANLQGQQGHNVENPVVVMVGEKAVNMMPMFTLTEERVYFIPSSTLLYAVPMSPSPQLVEAYTARYAPQKEETQQGWELSTAPKQ